MRSGALRRAFGAAVVIAAVASLLGHGLVGSTFAFFTGETTNTGTQFAAGWIPPATNMAATLAGTKISLGWTPGGSTPVAVTSQTLYSYDNGASTTCPAGGSSSYTSTLTITGGNSYADTGNGLADTHNGDYFCFEIVDKASSVPDTTWASTTVLAVHAGMVMNSVTLSNGTGTTGTIDSGDKIVIGWSQRTNLSGNQRVCAFTNGTVIVGDGSNCVSSNDATYLVKLTPSAGIGFASNRTFNNATTTSTTTAPYTTTITLPTGSSSETGGTPTSWTATLPASSTIQSSLTPTTALCLTSGKCTPTVSGNV